MRKKTLPNSNFFNRLFGFKEANRRSPGATDHNRQSSKKKCQPGGSLVLLKTGLQITDWQFVVKLASRINHEKRLYLAQRHAHLYCGVKM